MLIPQLDELNNPKKKSASYIKKHYPEFYHYIIKSYPGINKFNAGIYLYYNNMEQPTCPVCGSPVPFLSESRGFQTCCSIKCSQNLPSNRAKIKQTNLERYGVEHACQNKDIKDKLIQTTIERYGGMGNACEHIANKQKQTMKDRYGTEHALQNDQLLSKMQQTAIANHGGVGTAGDQKNQIFQTIIDRYDGIGTASQSIKEKIQSTNLEKYGCPVAAQSSIVREKVSKSRAKTFISTHPNIINIEKINNEVMYLCSCPHPECTKCQEKIYKIPAPRYCDRRLDGTEPCTKLLPIISGRNSNTWPEIFIKNVLEELNITHVLSFNVRNIIAPKEIDIFDPIRRIAFECNGIYWHSKKSPSYHVNKFHRCVEQGIQLITIWEDWIKTKPEIVRSIIRSKYHVFDESIYARKCVIEEVNADVAYNFLEKNHIQGGTRAQLHLGLFFNGLLVALSSFSKQRACMGSKKSINNEWELVRFCNKLNTQVIGGADKLIKHFIKIYQPNSIISFSSNDISDGHLYKRLGFDRISENHPYWYIGKEYKRYHRSNFTKTAIIQKGMAPDREHWTESEVMMEHGFVKIYDSGQTKWRLQIKKEEQ